MKRLSFFLTLLVVAMTTMPLSVVASESAMQSKTGDGTSVYNVVWNGETTVTYTATPYMGLSATYEDGNGVTQSTILTFVNGNEVYVSPNYPTNVGVYTVTATPVVAGDSLSPATSTTTLTINPATLHVDGTIVVITKFYDGNNIAEVTNPGTLNGLLGADVVTHNVTARFNNPTIGMNKDVTVTYTLEGPQVGNYQLNEYVKIIQNGAILEAMLPDTTFGGENGVNRGVQVEAYGYCAGTGAIQYRLLTGDPDQYRLIFNDPAFSNVYWTNLDTPGLTGSIDINIPAGIVSGDYTATLYFRNHNCPALYSSPITISFHVNLPETYVMPLYNDVIALVDTCHCLTDIQWYHREAGATQWDLIPGANDYYYCQEGGLTGEYFVSCKMDGMETFTCPQQNMSALISDQTKSVYSYPNPTSGKVRVAVEGSASSTHELRVLNAMGVVIENVTFTGNSTSIDLSAYKHGSYILTVDGKVTRVIKN